MANQAKSKPVAPQVAAKSFDDDRWEQYVRLSCVEIAANRAASAQSVLTGQQVIAVAKELADFVHKGG
jgi:hypothetical protein